MHTPPYLFLLRRRDAFCSSKYIGDEKLLRFLLESKYVMLNKENESGWTPLTRVAKRWQWAIVDQLMGEDAWIDPKDRNYHRTPLVEAAINAHEATVELLLKDGAQTLSIDKKGQTPLMQASSKENGPIVKL